MTGGLPLGLEGWLWLSLPGAVCWLALLLLPWQPWRVRERLVAGVAGDADLSDTTVLIAARDEAQHVTAALDSVLAQGEGLTVVLVDDQSSDDTAALVAARGDPRVRVVSGVPLPAGWSGKVWAQHQGERYLDRPLTLLMDADIVLASGFVIALRERMREEGAALASVMVELSMRGFWERLLMPVFVYFFKLLYPFRLANDARSRVAAAAGGCILLRTEALAEIGGFAALHDALIDDCTLARLVKSRSHRIWIGLSRCATSTRRYHAFREIVAMVARTAYTQLRHSIVWLTVCTLLMLLMFVVPLAVIAFATGPAVLAAGIALVAMCASYWPTLRYYDIPGAWVLALPVVGVLFLLMTWYSAVRYWAGEDASWRGRRYAR